MVVPFTDVTVISTVLAKAEPGGSTAHHLDGDVVALTFFRRYKLSG